MRLINADELMEHVWRDKLDSRELIAEMIKGAPTIKEIPTNIPIDVFEKLLSQEPKTGHWKAKSFHELFCDNCGFDFDIMRNDFIDKMLYCPNCGAKMVEPQERSEE